MSRAGHNAGAALSFWSKKELSVNGVDALLYSTGPTRDADELKAGAGRQIFVTSCWCS